MRNFAPMSYDADKLTKKFVEVQMATPPFYIDPNCTLDTLASMMNTNRTYLSKYVNEECGINFDKLMRRMRIAYAERLMHDHPNWSLTRVAFRSGFKTDTTFRKAFIEKYGMSPREYILKNGKI